ncbi:6-phosphogluconolactonase [Bifidobacterium aemilianum]|uniref:6-phosphogluconolactonase n=1 Tax=Bifidobacterium aemilianum TaxID=2493120 RepID=A0A366K9C3_9BIFI|nr:6-phosphogluconolactonase [Bifidobacterium aemilianum]RBP97842.1 6-phosphogluconolactonase [Bifidobacterium aemilianum]
MTRGQFIVYKDKDTLAQAAAQRIMLTLLEALPAGPQSDTGTLSSNRQNRFDLALTGGSDTIAALQHMASNPLLPSVAWERVHLWWADERFVAAGDEDRNDLQAKRLLLDQLVEQGLLPAPNIHAMPTDQTLATGTAPTANDTEALDAAAKTYEQELVEELGPQPSFDLLILGMGPDGHYASLFPNHPQVRETRRLVVGETDSPKMPPLRLTLTTPVLAHSRRSWFLTAGAGKAQALKEVLAKGQNPAYPASFADAQNQLLWLTTPDTVSLLS